MPPTILIGNNMKNKNVVQRCKVDLDKFGNKHMKNEKRSGDTEKGGKEMKKGATYLSCSSTCSEVYPQTLDKTMKYRLIYRRQEEAKHISC
jgi:hypothetical protein